MSEADVLLAIPEHVWAHAQQLYRLRRLPVAIVAVPSSSTGLPVVAAGS